MAKVLEFTVRTSGNKPLNKVLRAVENAMNLKFEEGEYDGTPAHVTNSLGMHIGLFKWGEYFILETRIESLSFLKEAERNPLEVVRISEAVADMLTIIGPFRWRVSTEADLVKDREYGDELDRRLSEDEGPPPWA